VICSNIVVFEKIKKYKGSEGFDPSTWRSEAARTIQTVLRVQKHSNMAKYLSSCLKVSIDVLPFFYPSYNKDNIWDFIFTT
jgi:hypothetical protein